MNRLSAVVCAAMVGAILQHVAYAEDTELRALLQVNAYGRKVEARVNGKVLPNITGGASQNIQLLHADSPDQSTFSEDLKNLFCLREGTNTIEVVYTPKEGEAPRKMEVNIRTLASTSDGRLKVSTAPVFEKQIEGEDKDGRFTASFNLKGNVVEKAQP